MKIITPPVQKYIRLWLSIFFAIVKRPLLENRNANEITTYPTPFATPIDPFWTQSGKSGQLSPIDVPSDNTHLMIKKAGNIVLERGIMIIAAPVTINPSTIGIFLPKVSNSGPMSMLSIITKPSAQLAILLNQDAI